MSLGRYIRQARQAKDWTQEELAKRSRISQTHVSQYENDKIKQPEPVTLWAIADAFGVHEVELVLAMGYIRHRPEDAPPLAVELQAIDHDLKELPTKRRAARLTALRQIHHTLQELE